MRKLIIVLAAIAAVGAAVKILAPHRQVPDLRQFATQFDSTFADERDYYSKEESW